MLEEETKSLTTSLQAVTRDRDQAMSDAAALRDAIMTNKQDAARKVIKHISGCHVCVCVCVCSLVMSRQDWLKQKLECVH